MRQALLTAVNKDDRLRGTDARILAMDEACPARLRQQKHGEAASEKPSVTRPFDHASAEQFGTTVHAAHAEFVATLVARPPRPIPIEADAIDLEDRATHLSQVFSALSAYLAVILDDTAQNVPGGLDLRDAEGLLADLAADLTGTIQRAADSMAGWLA
jgi:hypothetical protein